MKKFKSTRAQFVEGNPVAFEQVVEVDPKKVSYLIARGYLVEVDTEQEDAEAAKRSEAAKKAAATKKAKAEKKAAEEAAKKAAEQAETNDEAE